jgi:hypothetical protein
MAFLTIKTTFKRLLGRDHPPTFLIDQESARRILGSGEDGGEYEPIGRYYLQENGVWVGIDNSTGDAWTEEFPTKRKCLKWLRGGNRA